MIDPIPPVSSLPPTDGAAAFDAAVSQALTDEQSEKVAVAVGTALFPIVFQVSQMAMSIGQEAATATDE